MTAEGMDIDGCHWFYCEKLAVEFDLAFAFKDDIDLSHSIVIMRAGVAPNLDQVHTRQARCGSSEGAPCLATWAFNWRNLIELGNEVIFHKNGPVRMDQVSKPADRALPNRQTHQIYRHAVSLRPADWEIGDTAGLETRFGNLRYDSHGALGSTWCVCDRTLEVWLFCGAFQRVSAWRNT